MNSVTKVTGSQEKKKFNFGKFYKRYGLFIILGVMIVVMTLVHPRFFAMDNFANIMRQMAVNGLLAIGVTFIILTGGIDLSIGSIVGFAGVIAALVAQNHNVSVVVPILAGCLAGMVFGVMNGIITAVLRVPPFITTLGMLSVAKGITYIICNARPVPGLSPQFLGIAKSSLGPIPLPMVILAISFLIASIVLYKTRFGRYIYAIGGNREAAITSGLKVKTVEASAYAIGGLMAGLAAVVLTSRVSSGLPGSGEGYELDAIAASVIGGISLSGGEGRLWGTLLGAVILAVIQNALDLMVVSTYLQFIIKGALIIGAVYVDRLTKLSNK
ncbi:MAG: ABC transporter permease [Christensenellales bacterium]|jgi:inositol transport system permease protein